MLDQDQPHTWTWSCDACLHPLDSSLEAVGVWEGRADILCPRPDRGASTHAGHIAHPLIARPPYPQVWTRTHSIVLKSHMFLHSSVFIMTRARCVSCVCWLEKFPMRDTSPSFSSVSSWSCFYFFDSCLEIFSWVALQHHQAIHIHEPYRIPPWPILTTHDNYLKVMRVCMRVCMCVCMCVFANACVHFSGISSMHHKT